MDKKILDKIPTQEIDIEGEKLGIYRLGSFDNEMFELVELNVGQEYKPHIHKNSEAKLHVVIGNGTIIIDGEEKEYKPGNTFKINKGTSHGFKVNPQTLMLSIQSPAIVNTETGDIDFEYSNGGGK